MPEYRFKCLVYGHQTTAFYEPGEVKERTRHLCRRMIESDGFARCLSPCKCLPGGATVDQPRDPKERVTVKADVASTGTDYAFFCPACGERPVLRFRMADDEGRARARCPGCDGPLHRDFSSQACRAPTHFNQWTASDVEPPEIQGESKASKVKRDWIDKSYSVGGC